MSHLTAELILELLERPDSDASALLDRTHRVETQELWKNHRLLYDAFGYKLIGMGLPTEAFELVREGLTHHHYWLHPEA